MMRLKTVKLAVLLLCLACSNGCGTYFARTGWRQEVNLPRHYPATHYDFQFLAPPDDWIDDFDTYHTSPLEVVWGSLFLIGGFCIAAADLPISVVTDTLFLPYDHWFYDGPVDDADVDVENLLRKHGLCSKCSYDLRGSTDRCPECGTPIPPADEATR